MLAGVTRKVTRATPWVQLHIPTVPKSALLRHNRLVRRADSGRTLGSEMRGHPYHIPSLVTLGDLVDYWDELGSIPGFGKQSYLWLHQAITAAVAHGLDAGSN